MLVNNKLQYCIYKQIYFVYKLEFDFSAITLTSETLSAMSKLKDWVKFVFLLYLRQSMKNSFLFTLLLTGFICFFSCAEENEILNTDSLPKPVQEKAQVERLQFNSIKEMEQAELQGTFAISSRSLKSYNQSDFISLMSPVKEPELREIAGFEEGESEDYYYYALGYDSLIPNKHWARLFNKEGEMQIKDDILKITANGTYIYKVDKEARFKTLLSEKPNLLGINKIKDREYSIEDDILFIDTYGKIEPLGELFEFDIQEDDMTPMALKSVSSKRTIPSLKDKFDGILKEIGYGDFPIFSSQRKTWAGKLIQGITKNRATRTVNFSKTRRVRGKFYGYDWGFKQEAGVEGWTDAKRGFGNWTKTRADELVLGWQNITFSVTYPKHLRELQTMKEFRNSIKIQSKDPFMQPFTTKVYSLYSANPQSFATEWEVNNIILNSLKKGRGTLKEALKNAVDILNKKGANHTGITKENINNSFKNREALVVYLEGRIVVHIPYDFMRRKGTKHETVKFYSRNIEDFTLNLSNNTIPNITNEINKIQNGVGTINRSLSVIDKSKGIIKTGQGVVSLIDIGKNILKFNHNSPDYKLDENEGDAFVAAKFGNVWKGFRVTYSNEAMHKIKNEN